MQKNIRKKMFKYILFVLLAVNILFSKSQDDRDILEDIYKNLSAKDSETYFKYFMDEYQDNLSLSLQNFSNGDIKRWIISPKIGKLRDLKKIHIGILFDQTCSSKLEKLKRIEDENLTIGSIPHEIGNLKKLNYLSIFSGYIKGKIPKTIGQLEDLTELNLEDNLLSGTIPKELDKLDNLTRLNLSKNLLSGKIPKELMGLKNLEVLYLEENYLNGNIPKDIILLENIKYIDLSSNRLSGEIPKEFGNLPTLIYLSLNNNKLSGEIPKELGNLYTLKTLDISYNSLFGKIPKSIGDINTLTYLNLSNNKLQKYIPKKIFSLKWLKVLDLSHNQLQGVVFSIASKNLDILNLSHNQLAGNIPSSIGKSKLMKSLALNDNNFSGEIPKSITELSYLKKEIFVSHMNQYININCLPPTGGGEFTECILDISNNCALFTKDKKVIDFINHTYKDSNTRNSYIDILKSNTFKCKEAKTYKPIILKQIKELEKSF